MWLLWSDYTQTHMPSVNHYHLMLSFIISVCRSTLQDKTCTNLKGYVLPGYLIEYYVIAMNTPLDPKLW